MKLSTELLPWHEQPWARLQERLRGGTLPHALLLTGSVGLGKERFAFQTACALLCEGHDENGMACGRCRSCQLLAASSHPDLLWLTQPPAGADGTVADADKRVIRIDHNAERGPRGRQILVEQVRTLIAELNLTSQMGGRKIAVISPADRLIWNAANALLKTLEEPASDTLILLVAAETHRLPATVRSRCQRLQFRLPAADTALEWLASRLGDVDAEGRAAVLEAAGGAPLRALELHASGAMDRRHRALQEFIGVATRREDAVMVAGRWARDPGFAQAADWLHGWCLQLIRSRMAGVTPSSGASLHEIAEGVDLEALFERFTAVEEARALAETNLKPELLLVDLLSAWVPDGARR